jgi:beta-lactamase regulating signal transducer with metallopeptidase domain
MNDLGHFADVLLTRLAWTSIQAAVLIAVVLLIVRLLPRLPAAMRCTLWWLVSVQLLLGLCWHAPVALPLLNPVAAAASNAPIQKAPVFLAGQVSMPMASNTSVPRQGESLPAGDARDFTHWPRFLPALWLLAMLVQLPLLARQWWRARRLLGSAEPLIDGPMQALCNQRARALGLRRCPPLYVCRDIDSPQVNGLRQPVVLLPAVHAMTPAESAMAIAHELAHLRRGDLWLGWLPAIAGRLFFFHPLVRWALREYAFEREAACDAEVLRQTGTLPHAYAQLLLRLGVAHPMHAGLAGASPTFQNLKRRLTMLQHIDPVSRRQLRGWLLVAVVAAAGVLPYRVTAASSKHDHATPPAASATTVAPAAPMAPMPPLPPMNAPTAPRPMAPPPPLPPPPPPLPPSPRGAGFSARHMDIDTTSHARNGFALFDGDSITINGSDADVEAIRKLGATNTSMLWFRRGNDAYVIHDKTMLDRARRIYAPVTALAQQQGELAGKQGTIAGRQAGLAAQDAAFAEEQAALAQRQAAMAARDATRQAAIAQGMNEDVRHSELEAQQRALEGAQAQLEQRHAELEARQATRQHGLETQQAGLEKQQQAMERRQQQAQHDAAAAMDRLLDEALARGLAQKTSLH